PDLVNGARQRLETYLGRNDDRIRQQWQGEADRWQKLVLQTRQKKRDRTFALAAAHFIQVQVQPHRVGERVDADGLVQLAEQAQKACPCRATQDTLINALLFRAHRQLVESDPSYKKLAERVQRVIDATHLLGVVLTEEGMPRQAALDNADLKRTCV